MTPLRIASFSSNSIGGNPAGVVIVDDLPDPSEMQDIAATLGFSETAFAAPKGKSWRVRYYAPVGEVAFCGHATIALGAALGAQEGAGRFDLNLRDADISVEAMRHGDTWHAALQSPETWSRPLADDLTRELTSLFSLVAGDLDHSLPPTLAFAGVKHAILTLKDRAALSQMSYPFEAMRDFMSEHDLVTVSLLYITGPRRFEARNAFASGGVVEDPATGAAAAALGGALVDLNWDGLRAGGKFEIGQGQDMGVPSALTVEVSGKPGASVRVSGAVRWM
ncbi:MAG: PhzF family phenazine biosynthesis protein [Sulfitobacter sp.]